MPLTKRPTMGTNSWRTERGEPAEGTSWRGERVWVETMRQRAPIAAGARSHAEIETGIYTRDKFASLTHCSPFDFGTGVGPLSDFTLMVRDWREKVSPVAGAPSSVLNCHGRSGATRQIVGGAIRSCRFELALIEP